MRVLTGIKPTGDIHLGNYVGAIKQIIDMAKEGHEIFLFVADYHALNGHLTPKLIHENTKQILAALYAFVGDYDNVYIYLQSQIHEIFELETILTNYTAKGLLNRAHAYKTKVSNNVLEGKDRDFDVNIGLYNYPLLMSSDILLFNPDYVPVGADQKQHIEIARDIASNFNKNVINLFKLPEEMIVSSTAILGLDGRKMSKSYNNTIPLFLDEKIIEKKFKKIKSDSTQIGEKIQIEDDVLFDIMNSFASKAVIQDLKKMYDLGEGRGIIKQFAYTAYLEHFAIARTRFQNFMDDEKLISNNLEKDLEFVKSQAHTFLTEIKKAIGIYKI